MKTIDTDEVIKLSSKMAQIATDSFYNHVCVSHKSASDNHLALEAFQFSFIQDSMDFFINSQSEHDLDLKEQALLLSINGRKNIFKFTSPSDTSIYNVLKVSNIFKDANKNYERLNKINNGFLNNPHKLRPKTLKAK